MKFAVLMSVYSKDSADYLREAIESISIRQTLKPAQIVIVKDGPVSDDISEVIASCITNCPEIEFTVLSKSQNTGLASSLNIGLKSCKYDWVARMDADDISVPERFEKQFRFLSSNSGLSVIGSSIVEFDNDPTSAQNTRRVPLFHDKIVDMAKTRNPINHMTVVFKKDDVLQVGGYCESFGKLEDYKLWIDLIVAGKKMSNLPDVLVHARTGNGFIQRRSDRKEIHDWDMLQQYLIRTGIVNRRKAFVNRVYIRTFIYMPGPLKKLTYNTILRR